MSIATVLTQGTQSFLPSIMNKTKTRGIHHESSGGDKSCLGADRQMQDIRSFGFAVGHRRETCPFIPVSMVGSWLKERITIR